MSSSTAFERHSYVVAYPNEIDELLYKAAQTFAESIRDRVICFGMLCLVYNGVSAIDVGFESA